MLAEFRAGGFNTLIATCIGEEGLDIPQACPNPESLPIIPFQTRNTVTICPSPVLSTQHAPACYRPG